MFSPPPGLCQASGFVLLIRPEPTWLWARALCVLAGKGLEQEEKRLGLRLPGNLSSDSFCFLKPDLPALPPFAFSFQPRFPCVKRGSPASGLAGNWQRFP